MSSEAQPESQLHPRTAQSQSRSHSRRPLSSRHTSTNSVPYLPHGPDALLYPEGAVSEEAVELLHEFVNPGAKRREEQETLVGEAIEGQGSAPGSDDEDETYRVALKSRPWYKRPSPWWLLSVMPFSAIAMSSCIAPRVEIYTELACRAHKPEYTAGRRSSPLDFISDNSPMSPIVIGPPVADSNATVQSIGDYAYSNLGLNDEDEEEPSNPCASDPVVIAAAAKIIVAMTTTMGILSCITTGFWGSLSDRHGRLRIMGISVVGLLITDVNFIFVSHFSEHLPGGYWFLLLGPIVEGALGGFTSGVAAIHAYVADTTTPAERSRTFSLSLGLLFIGITIGPTVGALLIRMTHHTLSVFYLATSVHVCYAILVWFIIPESVSPRVMQANREKYAQELDGRRFENGPKWLITLKRVFSFLSPLAVFAPERVTVPGSTKTRRDWSLTLLIIGFGFSMLVFGSYQYKFQYVASVFGWTSEELGYWLSLVGATRAVYLTVALPLIIKIFNRPKAPIQLPVEASEPLNPTRASSTHAPSSSEQPHETHPTETQAKLTPHTPSFDLWLARFSQGLEVVCYTAIPLLMYPSAFTVLSMVAALGGGYNPAVQALALELFTRRSRTKGNRGEVETGKLFGALSVLQAMCSQIIGPMLFGITYMKTVSTYPKTIFFVSSGAIALSFICLSLVRISKSAPAADEEAPTGVDREQTLVDITDMDEQSHPSRSRKSVGAPEEQSL